MKWPFKYGHFFLKMLDKIYELDQKGKVRGSDVAGALHQTKPSITRALCAMDAMGWITKEDSVTDKRVVYIVLTDKGREIHQHYIASYYSALSKRLEKYKEEDINVMMQFIDAFYQDLSEDPMKREEF